MEGQNSISEQFKEAKKCKKVTALYTMRHIEEALKKRKNQRYSGSYPSAKDTSNKTYEQRSSNQKRRDNNNMTMQTKRNNRIKTPKEIVDSKIESQKMKICRVKEKLPKVTAPLNENKPLEPKKRALSLKSSVANTNIHQRGFDNIHHQSILHHKSTAVSDEVNENRYEREHETRQTDYTEESKGNPQQHTELVSKVNLVRNNTSTIAKRERSTLNKYNPDRNSSEAANIHKTMYHQYEKLLQTMLLGEQVLDREYSNDTTLGVRIWEIKSSENLNENQKQTIETEENFTHHSSQDVHGRVSNEILIKHRQNLHVKTSSNGINNLDIKSNDKRLFLGSNAQIIPLPFYPLNNINKEPKAHDNYTSEYGTTIRVKTKNINAEIVESNIENKTRNEDITDDLEEIEIFKIHEMEENTGSTFENTDVEQDGNPLTWRVEFPPICSHLVGDYGYVGGSSFINLLGDILGDVLDKVLGIIGRTINSN